MASRNDPPVCGFAGVGSLSWASRLQSVPSSYTPSPSLRLALLLAVGFTEFPLGVEERSLQLQKIAIARALRVCTVQSCECPSSLGPSPPSPIVIQLPLAPFASCVDPPSSRHASASLREFEHQYGMRLQRRSLWLWAI